MPNSIKMSPHPGAMIALFPSADVALALNDLSTGVFGEDAQQAADLHMTLIYLAEDASIIEDKMIDLQQALDAWSKGAVPFTAKINGVGRFKTAETSEDDEAVYANVDAPELPDFRQQLLDVVKSAGISPIENHGFTPHITLAYLKPDNTTPDVPLWPIELEFNRVVLVWNNSRTEFVLLSGSPASQQAEGETPTEALPVKTLPDDVLATLVQLGMDTNNRNETGIAFDDGELFEFVRKAARELGYVDDDNPLAFERVDQMIQQCQAKSVQTDMLMVNGTAIKSLGNGRVGGYLVVFSDGSHKDLEGDFFDKDCEFALDWYPERPMLYHHALDATLKTTKIGVIDTLKRDDVGLWAEAQLNLADKYVQYVQKMIEMGALGWSSQSPPYLVVKEPTGRIKRWIVIEGSATPTPAQPNLTKITTLKAYLAELEGLAAKAVTQDEALEGDSNVTESQDVSTSVNSEDPEMNEQMMRAVVQAVVDALGMQMSEEELAQLVQRAMPAYEQYKQSMAATDAPEAEKPKTDEEMAQKAIKSPAFLQAIAALAREAKAPSGADIAASVKATILASPGISKVSGFQTPGVKGTTRISSAQDRRFDHLKAHEMAFGHMVLKSMKKDTSEDYQRAMAYKTAQMVERGDVSANDHAVKSAFPFLKANEVMQSTLTGYGDEYVATYYTTRLWETIRQETPVYQELLKRGMDEQEIPQGYEKDEVPLESADPDWYVAAGGTDEDASSGMVTPTYSSSKFGTGQKEITLAKLSTRINRQKELDEDSVIDMAKESSRKVEVSGREQIEMIIINGDTTLSATTNINYINGTPAAAPSRPSYTLLDGILKLALVTNTANSRDASTTLTEADYLALMPLLGLNGKNAADLEKCMWIVDNMTYFASLNIPSVKTKDVNSQATVESGVLTRMYGIDLFRSAQMQLANSAGKVPLSGSPLASTGTLGRIALVRPDQLATRWKRKMDMYTTYYPASDTTQVVAHMRWGFGYRDNEAVAVSYNVPVTIS